MSIHAIQWALEEVELPGLSSLKFVLVALANYADADGRNCYPSQSRLARNTGLDERTIIRAIADLEQRKLLRVRRRPGVPNHYELAVGGALPPADGREADFDAFCLVYPRVGSRLPAWRAYLAARAHADAARILEALDAHKAKNGGPVEPAARPPAA